QAEDGIRDFHVTGVQTCALPIFGVLIEEIARDADFEVQGAGKRVELERAAAVVLLGDEELLRRAIENVVRNAVRFTPEGTAVTRSEERRVGEEGRGRGAATREKK